jgi:hypothetical protein
LRGSRSSDPEKGGRISFFRRRGVWKKEKLSAGGVF